MEITEEERNRLAALLKRKASTVMKEQGLMGLFTISSEICSPDSFMITPLPLPGFPYTGEFDCLQKLSSWLSFVDPSHYTQNHGGEKASVYKLRDYDMVLKCLKKAIAIACCFLNEGSILVVCPAILRFSWAEELERWLPILSPTGDHRPYDICHQIDMLWPGLLGTSKYEFAKTYCEAKIVQGAQGKVFQDFSKGVRLEELNVLLTQTVMVCNVSLLDFFCTIIQTCINYKDGAATKIRRLKEHLLVQLPPKRRQIVSLVLERSDINMAVSAMKEDECGCPKSSRELSNQELGECTVDNMRTLCVACHKEVTAAQAAERRVTRINAKKRLKGILCGLSNGSKIETVNSCLMVDDVDELLVKVPGSAYTGSELKCLCTETTTTNDQNNSFGES
ncbi:hypothetical protein IFM89_025778 [Coptis chinensis]|uniref:SNF2 N-terminal domain-containing protein n=1 Tax=Coptis chinensis TaxID=261450 RepID=A0A835LSG8_9MAGN|nr:hypothetical protein IFM89_025778 [Coptis chinensis]